jgi:hypothetical protein
MVPDSRRWRLDRCAARRSTRPGRGNTRSIALQERSRRYRHAFRSFHQNPGRCEPICR